MTNFLGKNDLKARDMLLQRSVYNGYALVELEKVNSPTIEYKMIKDFQKDEKLLIGRVDRRNNPIFVRPEDMMRFEDDISSSTSALGFVVMAFRDMKAAFTTAMNDGNLDRRTLELSELTVKKGFKNPYDEYNKYIDSKIEEFVRYVQVTRRNAEILNFDTFTRVFMDFVRLTAQDRPLTGSMYFLTKEVSPLVSGLAFEISNAPYDNDQHKIDHFYRQSNFEYLKNLAYKYGFIIDKHIPWRFVADIFSPNMRPYIKLIYGLDAPPGAVLTRSFVRTYSDDISTVKDIMLRAYNAIADRRPRVRIRQPSATVSSDGPTRFQKCTKKDVFFIRETLDLSQLEAQYPDSFWIKAYTEIRNFETGLLYNDAILNNIVKNAVDLTNSLDITAAMGYVIGKFDNVEHHVGSLFHDVTRIGYATDGKLVDSVDETVQRSVQASNFVVY